MVTAQLSAVHSASALAVCLAVAAAAAAAAGCDFVAAAAAGAEEPVAALHSKGEAASLLARLQ